MTPRPSPSHGALPVHRRLRLPRRHGSPGGAPFTWPQGSLCSCHFQSKEGASAGVTMVAALVSAFTGRVVRGDLAMTGEITLGGQVLPVGAIKEKVLAAHRYGLARVVLPHQNKKQADEQLGDDLRRAIAVDYVTQIDELLGLSLRRLSSASLRYSVRSRRSKGRMPLRPPGAARRRRSRLSPSGSGR